MKTNKEWNKFFAFALLILMLIFLFYGIVMIIQSKGKAIELATEGFVADGIKPEDKMKQFRNSIELYSAEYKRKGVFILISSSAGFMAGMYEMFAKRKTYKVLAFALLLFVLSSFSYGISMIMQSEDNAITLVTECFAARRMKPADEIKCFEKSIELCSKEYKSKGTNVLIVSSIGVIATICRMYTNRRDHTV